MTSRKKVVRIQVPHTREELSVWVARAGEVQRKLETIRVRFNRRIAKLKKAFAEVNDPLESELKQVVDGIAAFAEAHRPALTNDETTKTVDVGTGTIRWRFNPPRVSIQGPDEVLAHLISDGPSQFVRTTHAINREAMLAEPALAMSVDGVTIEQHEQFMVKPASLDVEIEGPKHRLTRLVG